MGTLTFRCPRTGQTIETGIATDADTLSGVRSVTMRVPCPHCAAEHEFDVAQGFLAEAA
ncbi:MAG TPA: hypothetical protein VGD36_06185 [Xanthobacteraceae bacterium]|jgi:hypothetical protein